MFLDGLASCAELTTEHAVEAASSSASMRDLLTWASSIARPGEGAPKILMAIARLASADWMEGSPFIEIQGSEHETTISVFATHGMGMRERVLPLTRLHVSVDEFARAVRLAPQLIAPFRSQTRGPGLTLALEGAIEEGAEAIEISETSLHQNERVTAPPPPNFTTDVPPSGKTKRSSHVDIKEMPGVHTAPTVRRMVAVKPEAFRNGNEE